MPDTSGFRVVTSVILVFVIFVSSVGAQSLPTVPADIPAPEPQTTSPEDQPRNAPFSKDDFFSKGFARRLLEDQREIWTSPARIKKSDAKWLVPLAGATVLAFTQDNRINHHFDGKTSLQNASLKVSNVGTYATWGVPGAFFAVGKLTHNERLSDTGERGFQAAVYSTIAMQGLKFITDRTRPYQGGNGHFWNGGNSFPSGHAMEAWALAKVVSDEYPDKPLVKIGMYSLATAISVSRITSQRHYTSDVLVGSVIGYLIGKFVMRDHHTDSQ
jgi:membrane-associated phospholipid phosphatase